MDNHHPTCSKNWDPASMNQTERDTLVAETEFFCKLSGTENTKMKIDGE
jgi:hypothetical protein